MQVDRYEAKQIGKEHLDIEIDAALAAIRLFQLLLQKLRELPQNNTGLERDYSPLTITVNGKEYYQAQLPQSPTINKLTPQQIKYLEQAISHPPGVQLEHKPDLEIKANDLVLFRANGGIIKTNQIQSTQVKQNSQIIDAEIVNESSPAEKIFKSKIPALLPQKGGLEVAQTALKLVNLLGEDYGSHKTFEGTSYIITQTKSQAGKSPELSIIAKDGRGEILKLNHQQLSSNLQDQDLNRFAQIDRELTQDLSRQQQSHQNRESEIERD